jgi:hypothetical protein
MESTSAAEAAHHCPLYRSGETAAPPKGYRHGRNVLGSNSPVRHAVLTAEIPALVSCKIQLIYASSAKHVRHTPNDGDRESM